MKPPRSILHAPFLLSFLSCISLPAEELAAQLLPSLPEAAYIALFPAPASFISLQAAA